MIVNSIFSFIFDIVSHFIVSGQEFNFLSYSLPIILYTSSVFPAPLLPTTAMMISQGSFSLGELLYEAIFI